MSALPEPERATSRVVGMTVRAARNAALNPEGRKMTVRDLAQAMTDLGHPIAASGVSDLENGKRHITVDQLTALATVLGVPPIRLLTPRREADGTAALAGIGERPHAEIVAWLRGDTTDLDDFKDLGLNAKTTLGDIAKRLHERGR